MPRMNTQTKLVFALEHIAHLYDLIERIPNWEKEYRDMTPRQLSKRELELLDGSKIRAHEGMIYGAMYAHWKELIQNEE